MQGQSYKKALLPHEKSGLVDAIAESGIVVQVKTEFGIIGLNLMQKLYDGILCSTLQNLTKELSGGFTIEFTFHKAKYEAPIKLTPKEKQTYFLQFTGDIFGVQRRSNFRAVLPSKWKRTVNINRVDGEIEELHGEVIDLSLKGCFFVLRNPGPMVSEDEISGEIQISDFPTIRFTGLVRRSNIRSDGKGFGVEFIEIEGKGSETLNIITLKASRENRDYSNE